MARRSQSTCRIVLNVTPDDYDRIRGHALEHSLAVDEWATRQLVTAAVPRRLTKRDLRARSNKAAFELVSLLLKKPAEGTSTSSGQSSGGGTHATNL